MDNNTLTNKIISIVNASNGLTFEQIHSKIEIEELTLKAALYKLLKDKVLIILAGNQYHILKNEY